MSRRKRPWGVIAGPIIFFGGLVVFLGVQKAEGIKDMVQDWGYQLEHSSQPVVMELPVYLPLFVGGDHLGPCKEFHRDLQVEMRGLAEDLCDSAREFRSQARRMRARVKSIR